jgi:type 1 glutamine amidotransferase
MTDEWYSFRNPRLREVRVLLTLDEGTYTPPANLSMGTDHPIAWKHCVGAGRAFYSAIGHPPASWADENHLRLVQQASNGQGGPIRPVARRPKSVSESRVTWAGS